MEQQQSYSPRTLQDLVPGQSGMILSVGNQSGAVKRRLVYDPKNHVRPSG